VREAASIERPPKDWFHSGSREGASHAAAERRCAREVPSVRRAGAASSRHRDRLKLPAPSVPLAARQQRQRHPGAHVSDSCSRIGSHGATT
jgi:hypothetical protein